MFGLSGNLKTRRDFYKSKMPTHGETLRDVVRAYANPAYTSRGPCPSFATTEDMKRRGPAKGWYGFPAVSVDRWPRPADFNGVFGFRCVAAAGASACGEYRNRDAEGYCCDAYGHRVIYPLVFRLNSERGFLIGRYDSDNGEVYIGKEIHDTLRGAFWAAHRDCERIAESEREYFAKDQAEHEITYLRGENQDCLKAAAALLKELRGLCPSLTERPAVRDALRGEVLSMRGTMRKNRKRIAELESNFWLAVENY